MGVDPGFKLPRFGPVAPTRTHEEEDDKDDRDEDEEVGAAEEVLEEGERAKNHVRDYCCASWQILDGTGARERDKTRRAVLFLRSRRMQYSHRPNVGVY